MHHSNQEQNHWRNKFLLDISYSSGHYVLFHEAKLLCVFEELLYEFINEQGGDVLPTRATNLYHVQPTLRVYFLFRSYPISSTLWLLQQNIHTEADPSQLQFVAVLFPS
jgi:hypothetical protein